MRVTLCIDCLALPPSGYVIDALLRRLDNERRFQALRRMYASKK